MASNKGGRLMAAVASKNPQDIQGDRNARARVKMRQKLRRRGHREPLAQLTAAELVQLMKESKPKTLTGA
ncbi:hypothetical protein VB780_05290 [Leptolyngbya sp. CCNP1308]|uniref:hypothetical protein n=1 Tax=Leptolyngbya sp. CCNP1308 TaxID=3110255 RepID=UPI002B21AE97|nr:hypothetical protein [Leptolyngbya sp. CCNP1308]MEA5447973.1 hypothetical protein [Leptolyngbya sp. CCNP1308]